MKINIKSILITMVCLIIILSIACFFLYRPIKMFKECERRCWDGSEYNTGVRDVKLFGESKDIVIRCTKEPKETDAMIDTLGALPFVKIKNDACGRKDEQ